MWLMVFVDCINISGLSARGGGGWETGVNNTLNGKIKWLMERANSTTTECRMCSSIFDTFLLIYVRKIGKVSWLGGSKRWAKYWTVSIALSRELKYLLRLLKENRRWVVCDRRNVNHSCYPAGEGECLSSSTCFGRAALLECFTGSRGGIIRESGGNFIPVIQIHCCIKKQPA